MVMSSTLINFGSLFKFQQTLKLQMRNCFDIPDIILILYYTTEILVNLCLACLQNDDVTKEDRFSMFSSNFIFSWSQHLILTSPITAIIISASYVTALLRYGQVNVSFVYNMMTSPNSIDWNSVSKFAYHIGTQHHPFT